MPQPTVKATKTFTHHHRNLHAAIISASTLVSGYARVANAAGTGMSMSMKRDS